MNYRRFDFCTIVWVLLVILQGVHASRLKRFLGSNSDTQTIDTGPYHWSQWTSWSSCNGTCHRNRGLGKQRRDRFCDDGKNVAKLTHCQKPYRSKSGDDDDDDDEPVLERNMHELDDVVLEDGSVSTNIYNEYEYQICTANKCPVNGGWSQWGNYGSCSVSNGHGIMTRHRLCNNPTPVYGGHYCIGSSSESIQCSVNIRSNWESWAPCSVSCGTGSRSRSRHCTTGSDCVGDISDVESCMEKPCAINGGWGGWTEFGECSRSCGNGIAYRTRQCNYPAPQNGGHNCTGSSTDFKSCSKGNCPIDGGWTSFKNMSCSTTCGIGVMTSFRTCTNPAPEYGGRNCTGQAYIFKHCKVRDCTVVNKWSDWSAWSKCTATCDTGSRTRTRSCLSQNDCIGETVETNACNMTSCPQIIDGGWSKYRNSTCSASCGNGTILSYRACNNPIPKYGGKDCAGLVHQNHVCNEKPCVIDGSWGLWSNWSVCGSSCGNGTQTRTRLCDSPAPQYGGQNCTGNDIETEYCFVKECPIDGGWSEFVNISCSVTCGRGQEIAIRDCNNPAPQFGGKDCDGLSHQITECVMPSCVTDGSWSEWSLTNHCGSLCGDGYALRYRACSNPAPENGGQNCTGESEERIECNNGPCPSDTPTCDKAMVENTLKSHALFAPTRPGPCSNMDYIPEVAMVKEMCGAPSDSKLWRVGRDVRKFCGSIPRYSPIAKVHREYKTRNYGILLDCFRSKLRMSTETCEDSVHELDVSLDTDDDWDYFTMTW